MTALSGPSVRVWRSGSECVSGWGDFGRVGRAPLESSVIDSATNDNIAETNFGNENSPPIVIRLLHPTFANAQKQQGIAILIERFVHWISFHSFNDATWDAGSQEFWLTIFDSQTSIRNLRSTTCQSPSADSQPPIHNGSYEQYPLDMFKLSFKLKLSENRRRAACPSVDRPLCCFTSAHWYTRPLLRFEFMAANGRGNYSLNSRHRNFGNSQTKRYKFMRSSFAHSCEHLEPWPDETKMPSSIELFVSNMAP